MTKKATSMRSPQKHSESSYDGTPSFDLNVFTQEEQNVKLKYRLARTGQTMPDIPDEIRAEARTKINTGKILK